VFREKNMRREEEERSEELTSHHSGVAHWRVFFVV